MADDERPPGPEAPVPGPPEPSGAMPPAPEAAGLPPPPAYTGRARYERGRPIPIREMRVGELLDAAIKVYRLNWKTYLGVAAFIIVPLQFIVSFFNRDQIGSLGSILEGNLEQPPPEPSTVGIIVSVVATVATLFFILPFLTAAFAKVTSDLYVGGQPGIAETYRFALSKTRSILWVSILVGLATFGGFLLLVIPGIIFYFRFVFSSVTVVAEGLRGTDAMRRSWRLAKGFFWKTFGTLILAYILTSIVEGVLSIPFAIGAEVIGPSAWSLSAIGGSIGEVVTRPFLTIIVVLLYFDLRIRKEGLDLAFMVDEMAPPT